MSREKPISEGARMYKIYEGNMLHEGNNSLTFSWKPTVSWYGVAIPPGDYTMKQINDEFRSRIKSITNEEAKITILPGTIIIEAPNYLVDVYNSSIRTILGWPEDLPNDYINPKILAFFNSEYRHNEHQFVEMRNFSKIIRINI